MPDNLYANPNCLCLPLGKGLVRLFQASYRRNVVSTLPVLEVLDLTHDGAREDDVHARYEKLKSQLRFLDATEFTLWDCAYNNSDFFASQFDPDDLEELSFEDFLELMIDCGIISREWPPVFAYEKRSFGDRFRGTFFEQVGTEGLYRRTQPTAWWTAQKFTEDLFGIKETPYKYIEERFLDRYFQENLKGLEVLEIGCGTGYFTRKIARAARRAVGMDYNPDYVRAARETSPPDEYPNLAFHVGDIIDLSANEGVFQKMRFDRIILIDTFLFLFDKTYQPALWEHRHEIMRNILQLLRDDGLLLILDPHPFWLTPWLGGDDQPFGILTEYRRRHLKVIPTIEEMTCFLAEGGLRIRRILEPDIDAAYRAVNPSAHAFMQQFPQWWFFEAEKA
jgi:SAM-dependent methyltransferase